jgi:hypothetical protein
MSTFLLRVWKVFIFMERKSACAFIEPYTILMTIIATMWVSRFIWLHLAREGKLWWFSFT